MEAVARPRWSIDGLLRLMRYGRDRPERDHLWQVDVYAGTPKKYTGHRRTHGLNTNNWGNVLQFILNYSTSTGSVNATNTSGTSVSLSNSPSSPFNSVGNNTYVQLGSGTTAPTRSDYNLTSPISGMGNITFSQTLNANNQMVGSAAISYTSSTTVSEVGLFVEWNSGGTAYTFLLDHAVFSSLSGTLFTIVYQIPVD